MREDYESFAESTGQQKGIYATRSSSCRSQRLRSITLHAGWLSAVTLLIGIFAPSFVMVPSLTGEPFIDRIIGEISGNEMSPQSYSLAGTVLSLFGHGELALGLIIFVFSIVFPVVKLVVLAILLWREGATTCCVRLSNESDKCVSILSAFGAWSMLDVFVVAIIVVGLKSFPGGTRIEREWGIFCFAVSIFLSLVAFTCYKQYLKSRKLTAERSRS